MTRHNVELPEAEKDILRRFRHADDLPGLRTRVYALRKNKWPLRAIGDAVGAPRSTVRMWELSASDLDDNELPKVPECPRAAKARGERVVRMRLDVPPGDREELQRLAASAKLVRSRTPKESPARKDAEKLDQMIERYIARGVPVKRIADRMGVTPRAVTARHNRYLDRKNGTE